MARVRVIAMALLMGIVATDLAAQGRGAAPAFRAPPEGQHPTLEEFFRCNADSAVITVDRWNHWSREGRAIPQVVEDLRLEIRNYVIITPAQRDSLSHMVSLLGYSGAGTMRLSPQVTVRWEHSSSFMSVRAQGLVLHLAPREWVRLLRPG